MLDKKFENRWIGSLTAKTALKDIMQLFKHGGNIKNENSPFNILNNKLLDFRGLQLNNIKISNANIINSDLSYSNFKFTRIEHSTFNNVIFERVEFCEFSDYGNQFINCHFGKCKFKGSVIGYEGTKFINCSFVNSNFEKTLFIRGEFLNCIFNACRLNRLDFNASSFENCIFYGKLDNVWFRGGYPFHSDIKEFGLAKKNQMKNVSFEKADLIDVTFSNECDLSSIIVPNNGKYFVFNNWDQRLLKLKNSVTNWPEKQKKEAEIFANSYLVHSKTQDWYIINTDDVVRYCGEDLATKIINELTFVERNCCAVRKD